MFSKWCFGIINFKEIAVPLNVFKNSCFFVYSCLQVFRDTIAEDSKLFDDMKNEDRNPHEIKITLAAKWAPSEKSKYDQADNGMCCVSLRESIFENHTL